MHVTIDSPLELIRWAVAFLIAEALVVIAISTAAIFSMWLFLFLKKSWKGAIKS
jgi:hypothetical protein